MPDPSADIVSELDTQWNAGNVVEPILIDFNASPNNQVRVDLRAGRDQVVVRVDNPSEEEEPIGAWIYAHRRYRVILELGTNVNRTRLLALKDEIRRICHARMHSLTNFQRLQYMNFLELNSNNVNVWWGRIVLELVNNAVLMEV